MKEYAWILRNVLKTEKVLFIKILIINIVIYIFQPLELLLIQKIIKSLTERLNINNIFWITIAYVAVYSLKEVQFSLSLLFEAMVENRILVRLYRELFVGISKFDLKKFDNLEFLLKVECAKETVQQRIFMIIIETFHFAGSIVSLALMSWLIISSNLKYIWIFIILSILKNLFDRIYSNESVIFLGLQDILNRHISYYNELILDKELFKEIRVNNVFCTLKDYREKKWNSLKELNIKFNIRWIVINLIWGSFMIIVDTGVLFYLIFDVLKKNIDIGTLVMLSQSKDNYIKNVEAIFAYFVDMKENKKYIEQLKGILSKKEDKNINYICNDGSILPESLKVENLNFSYRDRINILKDINLLIKKGESVAIIGENGCGKSTLVNIIIGLLAFEKGIVINNFSRTAKVFQDFGRYKMSLKDNIIIGDYRKEKTKEKTKEIFNIIEDLGFNLSNERFYDGIDTELTKYFDAMGIELSGGEWQKIAIARSFYKDANLVILDEATSFLDAISEQYYFNKIKEMLYDTSLVIVTHRVGIANSVDKVLFMKNGEIVGADSHDRLILYNSEYREFYESQASWYN